ncbi:ferredoxin-NADP reductase [Stella humosa]|uniref:Ferredoxin-NADP reductase n=1 Tax=Stella humosa TaxID=94 RepID=A0A3N1KJ27_9PROT|nr:FAD-dependent oxidoreductase [Stella humosa]ROP80831.1 ferredoxin-NADP reductase [Stella humosa]
MALIPDERVDVVVIGSGMGGMTAARLLAEFGGKRVLMLEQHYTPGGMTHEFTREGRYHFGTGVHYLTAGPGPILNYLTDGRVQFHRLPDDFDVLHFPGFEFAVPASEAAFRARLKARFPHEADAVDRFFAAARKAARGLTARNLVSSAAPAIRAAGLPVIELLYPDTFRTIADVAARHFRDPALRAIVSARWGLFGPPPATSSFGGHAMIALQAFMGGATHPVGGPKALGRAILDGLERFGVVVRPRQRVHEITVEAGRATGVGVEDRATGSRYRVSAPCIVSAVGARNTASLLGPDHGASWERELAKLPKEVATILLFVGLDRSPARLGLDGANHWFMPDIDDDQGISRPLGEGILFVSFSSMNNPSARWHTVEVMQFVDPAIFRPWLGTEQGARPEDYSALKAQVTTRLIDRLDRQWPGFRAGVAFAELATPLSFMTYQNSVDGAFYGLATSAARLRSPIARCRTDVKGLYLSGQDAWGPGIEAAPWGGIMAANAALSWRQAGRMWRAIRSPPAPADPSAPWRGHMRVSQVEPLTPSARRIRFEPLRGGELPFRFRAGQYVKLELPIAGDMVERAYSISSAPGERHFFEITVKREEHGLGSTFLHRELAAGEALRLNAPLGDFTLDLQRDLGSGHLLLIAGGVGITPIVSMLAAAAHAGHRGRITLLASFRSEAEILFAEEIGAFAKRLPGLDAAIFVTAPEAAWQGPRARIDREALRPHVRDVVRVHLCGPAAMMQATIGALTELGVPRDAIHTEAFVSSRSRTTRIETAQVIALAAAAAGIDDFRIRLRGGADFACRPGQTILAAANAAHVPFGQSCGEGACGRCRARVLSGPFVTDGQALFSAEEIAAGHVLACQTLPKGDLQIAAPGAPDDADQRSPDASPSRTARRP